jgi:hypothetical protein
MAWIIAAAGACLLALLATHAPVAALAGWRAGFLLLLAVPVGATVLLLIARLTSARWETALRPLLAPMPWLFPAAVPLLIGQALAAPPPPHLALWLSWPAFGFRALIALGAWTAMARVLAAGRMTATGAGLSLVAHGMIVSILAPDWLLGLAPGQPQTAIGITLAVTQILAACAAACVLDRGETAARRDLAHLLIAALLGIAYLLFVDFLVIWYGNLPARVGWYQARTTLPWSVLPSIALVGGVALPILLIAGSTAFRPAGAAALIGLALILCWLIGVGGIASLAGVAATLLLAAPLCKRMAQ